MSKTLTHSLLFNLFWAGIIGTEVYIYQYKLALLCLLPLLFLALHFYYFSENFVKEFSFVTLSLFIGLFTETLLPNLGLYHFGLVDIPGFHYPQAWIISLWMIFPAYLVTSVRVLNKYKIFGAYAGAAMVLSSYAILGEKLDLIFFETPKNQNYVLFVLAWYLVIRALFQLDHVLSKKIK